MPKGLSRYAAELMQHNDDPVFRRRLEDAFSTPYESIKNGDKLNSLQFNQAYCPAIENLMAERFGLSITLDLGYNPLVVAATMLNPVNNNHVFLNDGRRGKGLAGDVKKWVKKNAGKQGTFDPKTGRVGGIFSTYKHQVFCDVKTLQGKGITLKEMCAIVMHEIGHIITWYEYADRLDRTNQIIADIIQRVNVPTSTVKEQTYSLGELVKKGDITEETKNDLLATESKIVFTTTLAAVLLRNKVSQSPDTKYDDTSSEQLADAFAARLGYYRELVTGLDKFYTLNRVRNKALLNMMKCLQWWNEVNSIYSHALFIAYLIRYGLSFLFPSLRITWSTLQILGFIYAIYLVWTTSGDDKRDMTYDALWHRYNRLKLQAIDALKDTNLDQAQTKRLIETFYIIDKHQGNVVEFESITKLFVNYCKPGAALARDHMNLQKLTEALIGNDLFLRAAELRLLTMLKEQQENPEDEEDE